MRTGLSSLCTVERDILFGDALLWLAMEREEDTVRVLAATSTSLQCTDDGKVCGITACAGEEMPRWLNLIDRIEEFARSEGCGRVRICGRKGWRRVLDGYRKRYVILDKELN